MSRDLMIAYGATFIAFVAIDMLWLGTFGASIFRSTLGDVMASDFKIGPAVAFYLIYPIGLVYFAGLPAMAAQDWQIALVRGAALGFFAYATYEFTNWATIRNWTAGLAIMDLVWGTVLSGVAATIGTLVARYFAKS